MASKQPSFHDRADLSDLEVDTEPNEVSPKASTGTLVPIEDTGVKQVKMMGRETRSLKRTQDRAPEEDILPRGKKSRTCGGDDLRQIMSNQQKQGETLQEILKELRNLTACLDNLKTNPPPTR